MDNNKSIKVRSILWISSFYFGFVGGYVPGGLSIWNCDRNGDVSVGTLPHVIREENFVVVGLVE